MHWERQAVLLHLAQTSFFPIIYGNMLPSKHALPIYLVLLICGAAELCVLPAEFPAGQAGDKNTVESTEPIYGLSILSHRQDSNTDSECSLVNLLTVMWKNVFTVSFNKGKTSRVSIYRIQADGPIDSTPSLDLIVKQFSFSNSHA